MTEINGIVYVCTNLINGKKYVGQTIKSLHERILAHKRQNRGIILYHALKKYGEDWFKWDVIDTANNVDDLNAKEIYWIKKLNTFYPNGYNLQKGGRNGLHSEETKLKMSKNNKSTRFITFNGKTQSITNWEKEIGIKRGILGRRLKMGWSVERALTSGKDCVRLNYKMLTFNGKTQNMRRWAKEIGITPACLKGRLKKGLSLEEALTSELFNVRNITYNGKTQTLTAWAKELNIDKTTLCYRLNIGWDIKRTLTTNVAGYEHLLTYKGKTQNMSAWAKEIGINYGAIKGRLKRGWSVEKTLTAKEQPSEHLLTFNGKTQNLAAWSKETGINMNTISNRIIRGTPVEIALTNKNILDRVLTYNGKSQTIKEWADEVGIPRKLLLSRLNSHKWSVERALTTPVKVIPKKLFGQTSLNSFYLY